MELFNQLNFGGMEIIRGKIIRIGEDGKLEVKCEPDGFKMICDFLRTSAGPLPKLFLGTPVLCIACEQGGYVLGVVQPYLPEGTEAEDPKQLNLKAAESIELTCGESMLSMNEDGKIVLRGKDITTRAAGSNKIKGSDIHIN